MKNERNFCPARGAKVRLPLLPCGRETDGFEREGERLAELNGGAGRRPSLSLSLSGADPGFQVTWAARRSVPLCQFDTGQLPDFLFSRREREAGREGLSKF